MIHIIRDNGKPFCGFLDKHFNEWPDTQLWMTPLLRTDATCVKCKEALQAYENGLEQVSLQENVRVSA